MDDAKRSVDCSTRDFLAAWCRGDAGPVPCGDCSACCYYALIPEQAGHGFRNETGHQFRFDLGHSDLKSATLGVAISRPLGKGVPAARHDQ